MAHNLKRPVGGGAKKVLYTLNTVRKIGIAKSAKALSANNACKACGLGMGGQLGGMTNELGEFPSVCNKSVQAQSTDIQAAIPDEVFEHTLEEFGDLTPHELEHLGRLANPVFKEEGSDRFQPIDWDQALRLVSDRLARTAPDRSFFYSSGRSSNEAGFVLQLLARAYGTNNITNCSYYCHQATSEALAATIGTGTATVELADLARSDLVFVIGANPSSNHPRFIHLLKAVRDRGGEVIVINPAKEPGLVKFAIPKSPKSLLVGGDEIASCYLQPKIGSDIYLFKGLAKALIEADQHDTQFIAELTTGFDAFRNDIKIVSWDEIVTRTGIARSDIESAASLYAKSRSAVFSWGMGMTHHLHGVANIESISNLALLRSMIGRPGAGLLPLRGHSNVQGIGTIGVKPVLAEEVIKQIETIFGLELPTKKGLDTLASLEAAHAGAIDAALVMGGNLYAATPNSAWAGEALDKIGFKAFMTTTLNSGHLAGAREGDCLILPVAARDEEWEPTTQESMFNFVRMSDGGIVRHANVRPETNILAEIAQRILPDSPINFGSFREHRKIRQAISAIVPGMEELEDIDVAKHEFHVKNRLLHTPQFRTEDGKAKFTVCAAPTDAVETHEDTFTLATIRSEGQFNSIIYEEKDSYRGTSSRWSVLMNSDDIARLGIAAGQTVTLSNDEGKMVGLKVQPFDVPIGNLLAYYPEANVLTSTKVDERSKTPAFKSIAVRLEFDPV